jgi:hypothetical protein
VQSYLVRVSDTSAPWNPGDPEDRVAVDATGRVVTVETGVARVRVRGRVVRASYGGVMLALVAQDAQAAPRVGDRVLVRLWADGCRTLERVVARAVT